MPDATEVTEYNFNKYLLTALHTDFPAHHPDKCEDVLQDIDRLERGDLRAALWEGMGFQHRITRSEVTFEHTICNECSDWRIWSCTLAQYQAALLGWRRFIEMPESLDSELIIDMPDRLPVWQRWSLARRKIAN